MPCEDVTEVIHLVLDEQDRLVSYELTKRSCGRGVGAGELLQEWACQRTADDLMAVTVDEFLDAHPTEDEAEEYLFLKHLLGIQAGLGVLLGHESGSIFDLCTAEAVVCDDQGTEFTGQLKIAVMTEKIRSCGRCGTGCGVKKPAT